MSKVIGIFGESGSGKTTSLRNLDPSTTLYIDCDKKGLSWKGWRNGYIRKENYFQTDIYSSVMTLLRRVNGEKPEKFDTPEDEKKWKDGLKRWLSYKTVVIDTLNGIMVGEEMRNLKVTGYGKWTDLADHVWGILDYALTMRDDINVIILCHSETLSDDNGVVKIRIKTNGRKLEKLVPESKLTTLLYSVRKEGKYKFVTAMDNCTAKVPMGAFEEDEIDNDIVEVIKALEEY